MFTLTCFNSENEIVKQREMKDLWWNSYVKAAKKETGFILKQTESTLEFFDSKTQRLYVLEK